MHEVWCSLTSAPGSPPGESLAREARSGELIKFFYDQFIYLDNGEGQ